MRRATSDMWREIKPHAGVIKESAQLAGGAHLHALLGKELERLLRVSSHKMREHLTEDPHMPSVARRVWLFLHATVWPDLQHEIYTIAMKEHGYRLKQYEVFDFSTQTPMSPICRTPLFPIPQHWILFLRRRGPRVRCHTHLGAVHPSPGSVPNCSTPSTLTTGRSGKSCAARTGASGSR